MAVTEEKTQLDCLPIHYSLPTCGVIITRRVEVEEVELG